MNYLSNRQERNKVGGDISTWEELLFGIPQWSDPLLFNIYLNDFFYTVKNTDICNFADDNTLHSSRFNLKELMADVEDNCSILVEWFCDVTLDADKCHSVRL